jgi:hypothetical protein
VKEAAELLDSPLSKDRIKQREDLKSLPGSASIKETEHMRDVLASKGVQQPEQLRLLGRYGKRFSDNYLDGVEGSPERLIELETRIALDTEQVENLEDLMRRRLELEYTEGHGICYLPVIREVFRQVRPEVDFDKEEAAYRARMAEVDALLKNSQAR